MRRAIGSGLILTTRVGKHTDEFIEQLVVNTEGKTNCQQWRTDGWGGYERILGSKVSHIIGIRPNTTTRANQWNCQTADWTERIVVRINLPKSGNKQKQR